MHDRPGILLLESGILDAAPLRDELLDRLPDVDVRVVDEDDPTGLSTAAVVVTSRFDEAALDRADALSWLHVVSAGYDHLPLDDLAARDVAVTNASGVHAEPAGEQVLGYLLAFERNLHRAVRQQVHHEWERHGGTELRGKTVGVVGLGAIGGRVAELASALGTTVLGTKRDPATAPAAVDEAFPPEELDAVLARSDYVVVACPLTDATRHLLDADAFETMREDAVLVNVARGGVVDETALVDALESGEVGGAALDVFETEPLPDDSPLWDREDVLVTPHVAGSTPVYWARNADLVAENYRRFVAGDRDDLTNRVA